MLSASRISAASFSITYSQPFAVKTTRMVNNNTRKQTVPASSFRTIESTPTTAPGSTTQHTTVAERKISLTFTLAKRMPPESETCLSYQATMRLAQFDTPSGMRESSASFMSSSTTLLGPHRSTCEWNSFGFDGWRRISPSTEAGKRSDWIAFTPAPTRRSRTAS